MQTFFDIKISVVCHSDDGRDEHSVGVDQSLLVQCKTCEEAAEWIEKCAGDDSAGMIRSFANHLRARGPAMASEVLARTVKRARRRESRRRNA